MPQRIEGIFTQRLREICAMDIQESYTKFQYGVLKTTDDERLPHSLLDSTTQRFTQSRLSDDSWPVHCSLR